MFKEKAYQPRILESRKIILQKWKRNKDFFRQKLKKFVANRPALQKMLKFH